MKEKEEISKGYELQETELCILLAMKGLRELYGICFQELENVTQEDIYRSVFHLLKKGILYRIEDKMQIEEALDSWLEDIRKAQQFAVLADSDELVPERYYYIAEDNVILLHPTGQQGKRLFIEKLAKDEMWEDMKDHGMKVKLHTEENEPPKILFEEARECWYADKENLMQRQEIKQLLQKYDIYTRSKESQIIRFTHGLDEYLVYSDEQEDRNLVSWEGGEIV